MTQVESEMVSRIEADIHRARAAMNRADVRFYRAELKAIYKNTERNEVRQQAAKALRVRAVKLAASN
ncbi:hypothetical protein [Bradyrhizobium sp. RT7b]|uniref:hypothetical protein n=1 Tax=unclassified Bradyrhizobium TaxID=2631580 RepID=UPI00339B20A7